MSWKFAIEFLYATLLLALLAAAWIKWGDAVRMAKAGWPQVVLVVKP